MNNNRQLGAVKDLATGSVAEYFRPVARHSPRRGALNGPSVHADLEPKLLR
jgi:hypothetical protein